VITTVPWANPKAEMTKLVADEFKKFYPRDKLPGHIFNIGFTFEALMVCADAHKRAGSTNGTALADAGRTTKIEKRVMVGGPIEFDAKGQCNTIASVCLQNRNQTPTVVLPKDAAEMTPVFPDAELEPARLILLVINPLRNGEGSMTCRRSSWD
jgi:branched-chain amino acid transport system substrate-binding protein